MAVTAARAGQDPGYVWFQAGDKQRQWAGKTESSTSDANELLLLLIRWALQFH